jgi:hypothetical protein
MILVSMIIVRFAPNSIMFVSYADVFFVPLALAGTGAIPLFDDAIFDCSTVLIVTLLLGPLIALVAYLIVCAVKQECNGAMVAILLTCIVTPHFLIIPLLRGAQGAEPFAMYGLFQMLSFIEVVVSFAGWLMGNFFRSDMGEL